MCAFALLPGQALAGKKVGTTLGLTIASLNPGSVELHIESTLSKCEKKRQVELTDTGALLFTGLADNGDIVSTPGVGSQGNHQLVLTAAKKTVKVKGKKKTCKAATYDDGPYSIG